MPAHDEPPGREVTVTPRPRRRHWLRRIGLGAAVLVVFAVIGTVVAVRTDWGREKLRAQVEKQLAGAFVGGATLGGVDGNPLSQLVLHRVVINGADGKPAFSIERATVSLAILALFSHQARVLAVRAEGVDVDLRRNAAGALVTQGLLKPSDDGGSSAWSVVLPEVEIRRGHVRYDTGSEVVNFDGLELDGWASLPHDGPIDAGIGLRGTWRERGGAALALQTVVSSDRDKRVLSLPYLTAKAGDVSVTGNQVLIRTPEAAPEGRPARAPVISGSVFVDATSAAVARLIPTLQLPADLQIQVTAAPVPGDSWTAVTVAGRIDQTPVKFTGTADIDARHARGELELGALDLTKLTRGAVAGRGAGTIAFDVRPGGPRALPVATATIRGWGEIAGVPRTALDIVVASAGERARAQIHATGDALDAELVAAIRTVGDRLSIEGATLRATSGNPAAASGGKAPIRGALKVDLRASGAVRPAPSVAVVGTVEGRHLRMQDLSVSALHLAIDAGQLPNRPYGKAHVQLVDLVRGEMQLGELTVDAVDRTDGKLAVAVRSRPKQAPWLVDADAVVTPPADLGASRFAIDLVGHHVRTGNGADWYGNTGHVDIGPERIAIRDLTSASKVGKVSVVGSYQRAGGHQGDLAATVDVDALSLDQLTRDYRGKVGGRIEVTRSAGAWQGDISIDGRGMAVSQIAEIFDGKLVAGLHGRQLSVALDASTAALGSAALSIDARAPAIVTDPAAWQRLGRDAIHGAVLKLRGIELARAATLAGLEGTYAGVLNGDIQISPTEISGRIEARELAAPALRGLPVNATLELSQTAPGEVTPRLRATSDGVGTVAAQAALAIPDRPLDPAAWQRLGRGALHGASLRAEGITIEPALLARLGVTSELRGRATASIDFGAAARTASASIELSQLRGGGLVQPLDLRVTAQLDQRGTVAAANIASQGAPLVQIDARLPVSLVDVMERRGQAAGKATPLTGTARLVSTDAAKLLAVFGRSEITGGQIDGAIELGGTLGAPTASGQLIATRLTVPPGPRGKPVRVVERLAIIGSWNGELAKLDIDGTESGGGVLKLTAAAAPERLRDGTLNLQATKFDLVPILAFLPGPAGGSAGELDADLRLNGLDLRTAVIAGELHLRNARIPTAPTVGTLRAATIDAVVVDHEIRLSVDGKLGAGTASVKGSIALDGAAPNGGKAKIVLRKVSPIGSIEPQITADIDATLSRDRNQWKADLVVANGRINVPSSRGEKLKPIGAPDDMLLVYGKPQKRQAPETEPVNPVFVINIDLRSTKVESEEFRGLIHGKLEIRADGSALAMHGGIEADRGDLDLFGRRYYAERAAVTFDGPVDPLLDVRITHDFPDVTTITVVRGRLSKPELVMSSDPGTYAQGQLLGFLLGGEPGGDPQSGPLQNQVADAGQSFVANQIGGYIKKALPIDIDVLRYEAATASSSAAITVGTWLNSSLFLAYRQHLDTTNTDENLGEGDIEYWLTRRLVLQGTVGDRSQGVDLLWRKRY